MLKQTNKTKKTLGAEVSSCRAALEKQRQEVPEASWTAILRVGKLQAQEERLSQKQMGESDWGRHPVFLVWPPVCATVHM